jgi:hypothetical protein
MVVEKCVEAATSRRSPGGGFSISRYLTASFHPPELSCAKDLHGAPDHLLKDYV